MILQSATAAGWVGLTTAISLVVIALAFVTIAVSVAYTALATVKQLKRLREQLGDLEGDLRRTLRAVRTYARYAGATAKIIHRESRALVGAGRDVQRVVRRALDRVEERVDDIDALAEVVYGEVADVALGVASAMRGLRRGRGVLGKLRRLVVPGR